MTLADVIERGLVHNYLVNAAGQIRYSQRLDTGDFRIRVLNQNYGRFLHGHEVTMGFLLAHGYSFEDSSNVFVLTTPDGQRPSRLFRVDDIE